MLRDLKPVVLDFRESIQESRQAGRAGHVKAVSQRCFGVRSQVYPSWELEPARGNAAWPGCVRNTKSVSGR